MRIWQSCAVIVAFVSLPPEGAGASDADGSGRRSINEAFAAFSGAADCGRHGRDDRWWRPTSVVGEADDAIRRAPCIAQTRFDVMFVDAELFSLVSQTPFGRFANGSPSPDVLAPVMAAEAPPLDAAIETIGAATVPPMPVAVPELVDRGAHVVPTLPAGAPEERVELPAEVHAQPPRSAATTETLAMISPSYPPAPVPLTATKPEPTETARATGRGARAATLKRARIKALRAASAGEGQNVRAKPGGRKVPAIVRVRRSSAKAAVAPPRRIAPPALAIPVRQQVVQTQPSPQPAPALQPRAQTRSFSPKMSSAGPPVSTTR